MGRRRNRTKQKKTKYCDYSLFFLIIFLLGFGLVMLYSASAYSANNTHNDPFRYLRRQGAAAALGCAAMLVISRIDYHMDSLWESCIHAVFWIERARTHTGNRV